MDKLTIIKNLINCIEDRKIDRDSYEFNYLKENFILSDYKSIIGINVGTHSYYIINYFPLLLQSKFDALQYKVYYQLEGNFNSLLEDIKSIFINEEKKIIKNNLSNNDSKRKRM